MENGAIINGQTPQAHPQQDHDAHIQAHLALLELSVLQSAAPVLAALYNHILQHVSMKAREMVDKELAALNEEAGQSMQQLQLMVQAGAIDMATAQQMMMQQQQEMQRMTQFTPDQIEARVAQVEAELIKEVTPLMSYSGKDTEAKDPLVEIRMKELAIKEMEANHKAAIDQAKLELEGMKVEQRAVTDAARMELQEQIADDRNQVNMDRIEMQRQAMENRNAAQRG